MLLMWQFLAIPAEKGGPTQISILVSPQPNLPELLAVTVLNAF